MNYPITPDTPMLENIHATPQPPYHFCTITGADYVVRVLALYHSFEAHCSHFCLWICCIDQVSYDMLARQKLDHAHLIRVSELEDETLCEVGQHRATNEYCWTLKAPLMQYLLVTYDLEAITYCDGDLYVFADPSPLFEEWAHHSIYLCTQRDLPAIEVIYGTYQAGLIGFRNDDNGRQALQWWKEQCVAWCSAKAVDGKFGDQKYLDQIPTLFANVKISTHLGINAAPWNCIYNNHYPIEVREGQVYIAHDPLIVYHFACVEIFDADLFDLWSIHAITIPSLITNHIYRPYLDALRAQIIVLGRDASLFFSDHDPLTAKTLYKDSSRRHEMDEWSSFYNFCTIVSQEYLIRALALYDSLKQHGDNFYLWICCVDSESYHTLQTLQLTNVRVFLSDVLEDDTLRRIKGERTLKEYCWTLKSCVCEYLLTHEFELDAILYVDADMYFFGDPRPIFSAWGSYSIALCAQRAPAEVEYSHGVYQAGLIGFRREPNSLSILRAWKQKCVEWCFDRFDAVSGRWGDQKYLDYVPNIFSNISVIREAGIDAAPWNLVMNPSHQIHSRDGHLCIDDAPLICYHFGSLHILPDGHYDLWQPNPLPFTKDIIQSIYTPYLYHLQRLQIQYPWMAPTATSTSTAMNLVQLDQDAMLTSSPALPITGQDVALVPLPTKTRDPVKPDMKQSPSIPGGKNTLLTKLAHLFTNHRT